MAYNDHTHPDAFLDIKILEQQDYMKATQHVRCPKCKGHGEWHLQIDAFGKGKHFNMMCGQCWGDGWVPESDSEEHLHHFKELTEDECTAKDVVHFGKCYHVVECVHCGLRNTFDSGD